MITYYTRTTHIRFAGLRSKCRSIKCLLVQGHSDCTPNNEIPKAWGHSSLILYTQEVTPVTVTKIHIIEYCIKVNREPEVRTDPRKASASPANWPQLPRRPTARLVSKQKSEIAFRQTLY